MNFEISQLKKEELPELYDLIKLVFSNDYRYVVAKTKWAFDNNHSYVLVAKVDGKIVASRGGFDWALKHNEFDIKAIQFHGTSVHPDFRRMGVFTKLNKAYLKYAAENQYDYIFNVSVQSSRLGYEKLGWKYLKGFHRLTSFHKPIKLIKNKLDEKKVVKERLTIPKQLDELPDKFVQARKKQYASVIFSEYDQKRLNWRLNNAEENYRTYISEDAFVIYKIKQTNLSKAIIFGDVFLMKKSRRLFSKAIRAILDIEKPDISYTYISKNHPYYNFYLMSLYIPNPLNYHLHFGTKIINEDVLESIPNAKWALSFLDIDTF